MKKVITLIISFSLISLASSAFAWKDLREQLTNNEYAILKGNHYFVCEHVTKANAEIFRIVFELSSKAVYMNFSASSIGGMQFDIFEGASGISAGSNLIPRNSNRLLSDNLTDVSVSLEPTISSNGTNIYSQQVGADREAGQTQGLNKIILKPSTNYIFKMTSDANDNEINYCAEWYER